MAPSVSAILTRLTISSRETVQLACSPFDRKRVIISVILLSTKVSGKNTTFKNEITGLTSGDICSGNAAAIDLGITSAKIIIETVSTTDAIVTLQPYSIAIDVTSTGAIKLAILLPISIVVINWLG